MMTDGSENSCYADASYVHSEDIFSIATLLHRLMHKEVEKEVQRAFRSQLEPLCQHLELKVCHIDAKVDGISTTCAEIYQRLEVQANRACDEFALAQLGVPTARMASGACSIGCDVSAMPVAESQQEDHEQHERHEQHELSQGEEQEWVGDQAWYRSRLKHIYNKSDDAESASGGEQRGALDCDDLGDGDELGPACVVQTANNPDDQEGNNRQLATRPVSSDQLSLESNCFCDQPEQVAPLTAAESAAEADEDESKVTLQNQGKPLSRNQKRRRARFATAGASGPAPNAHMDEATDHELVTDSVTGYHRPSVQPDAPMLQHDVPDHGSLGAGASGCDEHTNGMLELLVSGKVTVQQYTHQLKQSKAKNRQSSERWLTASY